MAIHTAKDIQIFYSYAQKDEGLRERLDTHLATLRRQGLTSWYNHKILPGTERSEEIDRQLNAAHIILLLVSPYFIESFNCYDVEMERALERHRAGEARVIPIIVRPVNLQGTSFEGLETLPKNKKPVTKWTDKDEACVDIERGIRSVIDDIVKQGPLDNDNPSKEAISEAFTTQAQQFETIPRSTTPPITPTKLDFRRKLVTEYDLDIIMAAFRRPLDYGKAFRFVIAGDERVLRQYVIERMLQEFRGQIQGDCFTPLIDLNRQDLSYPLQSLLEEKIKRWFNYKHACELVTKHALEHVILTVWNYDLPLLTVQEAIGAFWKSFIPAISRHLDRKKLCFVLILAHLPPEDQQYLIVDDVTSLQLPDFDVQGELRPWLSRNLHKLNIPDGARDYCLNQLQDLYPNPVQILRRMEYIASYLQGEYDEGRFIEVKIRNKRKTSQK